MHRAMLIMAVLFSPTAVSAQARDTTPIPRELAMALLQRGSMSRTASEIVVGAAPRSFPRDLLPPTGTILGGIDFAEEGDGGSQTDLVALRMENTPDSALSVVSAHLLRAGWQVPTFPSTRTGGFTTTISLGAGFGKTFCHENRMIHSIGTPRPAGGSFVTLSLSGVSRTICDPRTMDRRRMRQSWDDIELPELVPPAGVRGGRSGSGSSDGYRESTARLYTTNSVASLVEHFGEQLKRAGWAIGGRLDATDVSVLGATKTDTSGRRLTATLLATRIGDTERDLLLRVVVPDPDR